MSDFAGYIGPPELHDGKVTRVLAEGDTITVFVESNTHQETSRSFSLIFSGVTHWHSASPDGMILYALVEYSCLPPFRKFVFANWDDEDKAELIIVATDFHATEGKIDHTVIYEYSARQRR